jgi:hypothetical protein
MCGGTSHASSNRAGRDRRAGSRGRRHCADHHGNNLRTSARRSGSGPAGRNRYRNVAEPAGEQGSGDLGEWRLHPDRAALRPVYDLVLRIRISNPDPQRRARTYAGAPARGSARPGADHRGGEGCRKRFRYAHKNLADCDELLSGADLEPADVAGPQLGPADGAGRSSDRTGGRVLVRRFGHVREPVPPQRRQHQREHPRTGLRHRDRGRDPGNHRRQRRRLGRVRAVQRRRSQHRHEVGRQQVLRQLS